MSENVCQPQEMERVSKSTWAPPCEKIFRVSDIFLKKSFSSQYLFLSFYSFKLKFWNIFLIFFKLEISKGSQQPGFPFPVKPGLL